MKKVGEIFETSDYSIFNYLKENRCSTTDVAQAVKDGKSASRTKDFARRVKNFEDVFVKRGFCKIETLPVWEDKDGKLYLGDGVTRMQALRNLQDRGVENLPIIRFTKFSHKEMTRMEFVLEMQLKNENNGKKWDITDKIEFAINTLDIASAKDVMTIAKKYQLPMNSCVNLVLNKQGTTKQDKAFFSQMEKATTWEYAYDVAEFLSKLYMLSTNEDKHLLADGHCIDSFRQLYNKAIITDTVDAFKLFWEKNIDKVVFNGKKISDFTRAFLSVMFKYKGKAKYEKLSPIFTELVDIYDQAICVYKTSKKCA